MAHACREAAGGSGRTAGPAPGRRNGNCREVAVAADRDGTLHGHRHRHRHCRKQDMDATTFSQDTSTARPYLSRTPRPGQRQARGAAAPGAGSAAGDGLSPRIRAQDLQKCAGPRPGASAMRGREGRRDRRTDKEQTCVLQNHVPADPGRFSFSTCRACHSCGFARGFHIRSLLPRSAAGCCYTLS